MNRLDFDAINARLNAEHLLPEWLPDGKRQGHEWVARNPTRNDTRPGSFTINIVTGKWADFATGDEGGDLVSLYAYLFHDNDNGKAARELAEQQGIQLDASSRQEAADKVSQLKDHQPRIIAPVPDEAPQPDFNHYKHGQPSKVWPYYDSKGRLLLFVCRFDHADGSKDILPYSWCDHPGKGARWTWRGITGNAKRPLYGQDRLAAMPDADVVMVEGEKAADAGQDLLQDGAAVVSWLGGTSTAEKVSLSSLRGRRVILWPDFDSKLYPDRHERAGELMDLHEQPGMKAMLSIAKGLAGVAREVLMVGYQVGGKFPDTWDLADAQADGWQQSNVMQYMGLHSGDPFHVAGGRSETDETETEDREPANENREPQNVPLDASINPFGFPHLTDKGQPMNTAENLAYLLGQYGIRCRYNVINKDVEITIPGTAFSQDNMAANCLAQISSLCARNRMPKGDLSDYITLIADSNPYNPAAEWIDSQPWDGQDRIRQLAETLDPVNLPLAETLLRRWMLGAVAAAFQDSGVSLQGVLVLQGVQGTGKTSWFWSLVDDDRKLGKEGAMLNPADRDSVKQCISYWLVELGELDATFRKADIAALKAFITRDRDELFLRYSRAVSTYPRRTAFMATVNERAYLKDETGNRRYWTIECGAGLNSHHQVNVQQVWAQVKHLWASGERYNLTPEESAMLNQSNEAHTEVSPIEELFLSRFDWEDVTRPEQMSATDALLAVGYDRPNRQQTREAGQILRKLTGGEPRKSNGRQVFDLPQKVGAGYYASGSDPF